MKTFSFILFFILFPHYFFAQDFLVKKDGRKISCKIIGVDSTSISYQNKDTTKKEIIIVPNEDVLAVQHANEKLQLFFIPDTLLKSSGEKVVCRITTMNSTNITYFTVDSTIGKVQTVPSKNFSMIFFGNGSQQMVDPKSDYVDSRFSSQQNYYLMGANDAETYYKCPVTEGMETLSGIATYALGAGLLMGAIVYVIPPPPPTLNNPKNPNNHLLKENKDYNAGYSERAKELKHKRALHSYGVGVIVPLAFLFAFLSGD